VTSAKRAFLDHASTSPLRPAARAALLPYLDAVGADPSRVYQEALVARAAVEHAREQVAHAIGARPREVVFTSGGTEACNSAVFGAVSRQLGAARQHVVVGAVEHSAVRDAAGRAPRVDVTVVPVDPSGCYDPERFAAAVHPDTALVCLQLVNHEVGVVQPVAETVRAVRARSDAIVFVDACAGFGYVNVDFAMLGADLLAVSAHKIGGPQGVGALLVRRGLRLDPFIVGGSQERARRAGLEPVAALVGFGAAAEDAADALATEADRLADLLAHIDAAATAVPGVTRIGPPSPMAPHIATFVVDGVDAEPVLLGLDQRGVAVHSGSSCASETLEPSPVLAAMGAPANQSIRASLGWSSTESDVSAFAQALPSVIAGLRGLASAGS